MTLTLLHTAKVHTATFAGLRDRLAPGTDLKQIVRTDWLLRARESGMTRALQTEIADAIATAPGPVLCTCTTIAKTAETNGALRIDRPLMQAAAAIGGRLCLVYCLQSTAVPSRALLQDCIAASGVAASIDMLCLADAWPSFEAGHTTAFAHQIAEGIRTYLRTAPNSSAVILAQASMADAARHLEALEIPVLTSPEIAFLALLGKSHIEDV